MPETVTPNYALIKPEIGGSNDVWGNRINSNLDILDSQIKTTETTAKNSLQKTGTVADRTALDFLFYDPVVGDPNAQSAKCVTTNGAVRALLNSLMPVGTIIMWGGAVATVPAGWALCNGQVSNGVTTPNLTDRFVIQGGGSWAAGAYGGVSTISYSGNVGYTALSVNEMPVHAHSIYDPTHAHGVSDPTHYHATNAAGPTGLPFGSGAGTITVYGGTASSYAATGISIAGAYTGVQTYNNGASWGHTHTIAFALAWNQFYPPFYAVCYIMRVAAF
jgi:microcystin-dependent protein